MNKSKLSKQIKPGCKVEIITGKYSGSKGTVLSVDRKKYRVLVKGINEVVDYPSRFERDAGQEPELKNLGVNISNVKLLIDKNVK